MAIIIKEFWPTDGPMRVRACSEWRPMRNYINNMRIYVHNYSARGHELSGCVRDAAAYILYSIYNLILISASYYYAPCMALVLYCV